MPSDCVRWRMRIAARSSWYRPTISRTFSTDCGCGDSLNHIAM